MSAKPAKTAPKNSVHFTLQGKGGVGKSLVSSLLAQYFQSIEGCTVKCVDTDPVNQTLANYKALNAQHVQLIAPKLQSLRRIMRRENPCPVPQGYNLGHPGAISL